MHTVQIDYELLGAHHVSISVYDMLGRKIETLVNGFHERGHYTAIFDSQSYSSGYYICLFMIDNEPISKKIEIYKGKWCLMQFLYIQPFYFVSVIKISLIPKSLNGNPEYSLSRLIEFNCFNSLSLASITS